MTSQHLVTRHIGHITDYSCYNAYALQLAATSIANADVRIIEPYAHSVSDSSFSLYDKIYINDGGAPMGYKFDMDDLNGINIVDRPLNALKYPDDVDNAPDEVGVYVFLNDLNEVVYAGRAGPGRLKEEIKSKKDTDDDKNTEQFIWAQTTDDLTARTIEGLWIKKYQPDNNQKGK
jgi:hypothetical protein